MKVPVKLPDDVCSRDSVPPLKGLPHGQHSEREDTVSHLEESWSAACQKRQRNRNESIRKLRGSFGRTNEMLGESSNSSCLVSTEFI